MMDLQTLPGSDLCGTRTAAQHREGRRALHTLPEQQRNHSVVLDELRVQLSPGPGREGGNEVHEDRSTSVTSAPGLDIPPLQKQPAIVPPAQCQAPVTSRSVCTLHCPCEPAL